MRRQRRPAWWWIQEWWGLNDQIKAWRTSLPRAAYRALVPDLYRGKVALEANEAQHLMQGLNFGDAAGQEYPRAVQYLKKTGSRRWGVTGFCMGRRAHRAVRGQRAGGGRCRHLVRLSAARVRRCAEDQNAGPWPLATQDQAFAIGGVDALEKNCREANAKFEFHRYNAKHAFANETADQKKLDMLKYDPKAAELARQRTMDFLAKHLK